LKSIDDNLLLLVGLCCTLMVRDLIKKQKGKAQGRGIKDKGWIMACFFFY